MALTNKNTSNTGKEMLRYARGQMAPQQMHALEKAALEDPFLAEALEGYMTAAKDSAGIGDTLEDFKSNIGIEEKKQEPTRIISLWRQKWLQYAVAASVMLAGGWWVFSLNKTPVNEKNQTIAQTETTLSPTTDSVIGTTSDATPADAIQLNDKKNQPKDVLQNDIVIQKEKPIAAQSLAKIETEKYTITDTEVAKEVPKKTDQTAAKANATLNKSTAPPQVLKDKAVNEMNTVRAAISQKNIAENNAGNFANNRSFTFNGKIVDANNNPLPFSNVTIPGEGVGTYSDAKGNFNFVYVDSTLPIRAKSLGYEEKNYTMQPDVKENRIVLQEDENLKKEMVVNRQEKQVRNQVYKPMIVEKDSLYGAEPSVGWANYNIYALNNSRAVELPVNRSVELSFDVTKTGEVANITVDKSSGKELDEEAVRLLKEGPKWKKKKGPNSRSKVILKF